MLFEKFALYATIYLANSNAKTKPDTKGIIMQPLIGIEPRYCIIPLLNLQIASFIKVEHLRVVFLDEFLEEISETEAHLKDQKISIK